MQQLTWRNLLLFLPELSPNLVAALHNASNELFGPQVSGMETPSHPLYLATAPKSNAVYMAYNEAADAAKNDFAAPVPLHIRNAPTKLMKQLEYGKGYKYAHDEPDAVANMDCLPDNLKGREFYKPTEFGFEKEVKKRLAWWKRLRQGE